VLCVSAVNARSSAIPPRHHERLAAFGPGRRRDDDVHLPELPAHFGQKPIEILAANTDKSIMLQLDVGTALETGNDPVAWIDRNPGRIRSLHLKEWSPEKGYKCLLGEGIGPWKKIFAAAEAKGGVEFYLIEQEGSEFPELETAAKCLENYKKMRA